MKIITRQDLANSAADTLAAFDPEACARIRALGDNPKPESVDAAIGSGIWTTLRCSSCRKDCARVVETTIGDQDAEYLVDKGGSVHLCADCVIQMADLFAVTK